MKTSYDAVEFETLADVFEGLKWRMISKPGGATVKPDDFYRCGTFTHCTCIAISDLRQSRVCHKSDGAAVADRVLTAAA
jgi:hypothetical protein